MSQGTEPSKSNFVRDYGYTTFVNHISDIVIGNHASIIRWNIRNVKNYSFTDAI